MQSSIPNSLKALGARKPLHIVATNFLDDHNVLVGFSDGTAAIYEPEELEKLRPAQKTTLPAWPSSAPGGEAPLP